jgi:hypothetical protein
MSHANHPVVTNDEVRPGFITLVNPRLIHVKAPRVSDKQAADASSQRSNAPSATNPTRASSSVHVGSHDANPEVLPAHSAGAQCLPQTQVPPTPLAHVPPNRHTPGSQSIAATVTSPPVPMSSVSPPASAQARGSPITATPSTMTPSSLPIPAHHSKPPATQEPQKSLPSPRARAPPSSFLGTNPPSEPIGVTPITSPGPGNRTAQHSHPQPTSNSVKPAPIQIRTKVDKPAQDGKGPTKSTKTSISVSWFKSSMPGAFPGPQMDDWVVVSPGPTDVQSGNWLKRLLRRHA